MKTLIEIIRTGRRPKQALVRIPILPSNAPDACTLDEPICSINAHFAEVVGQRGLIDAALMHGFDSANLPFAAMTVLAVDTPGSRSGDPREIYNAVQRPIYPLDEL